MLKPAIVFTALALVLFPMTPGGAHQDEVADAPPGHQERTASSDLDPVQSVRVAAAVKLFNDQGLKLPDLTFSFHDTKEGCNGHYGLYEPQRRHVRVCSEAPHILPHELAHAWMVENLDDATRQEFLDLRGLDAWADPDDEWRSRGVEDAAIIMRMVLTENGGPTNSPGWDDRRDAFALLTGRRYRTPEGP